jgi:hypothetical protein
MAEGVVLGEREHHLDEYRPLTVSLTPSGRVRIRVVRRSYGAGEKPVVDIAPDRLVVLKPVARNGWDAEYSYLPLSPLPTQDEANAEQLRKSIDRWSAHLNRLASGGELEPNEARVGVRSYDQPATFDHSPEQRARWTAIYEMWLAQSREELSKIETRMQ